MPTPSGPRPASGWPSTPRVTGFDSYDTRREIWHMEWRDWRGTTGDPAAPAPAAGGAQAPAHAAAAPSDELQDADISGAMSGWMPSLGPLLPWW